jgi:hypothetical protein
MFWVPVALVAATVAATTDQRQDTRIFHRGHGQFVILVGLQTYRQVTVTQYYQSTKYYKVQKNLRCSFRLSQ